MIKLTHHESAPLVILDLYDNHRLTLRPPLHTRTQLLTEAARHLVPGTNDQVLVTTVLITETGAIFYTPDRVPVGTTADITLPCLPPGTDPYQDPGAEPQALVQTVGTVIARVQEGLAAARRATERAQQPPESTFTTPTGVRVTNNRRPEEHS